MIIHSQTMKVSPSVSKAFVGQCHYLTSQVKQVLIMSDSDSELNKYRILMMKVTFQGFNMADIQKVSLQVLHGWTEYKLGDGRISHIFDGLI